VNRLTVTGFLIITVLLAGCRSEATRPGTEATEQAKPVLAVIETNMGSMAVELFTEDAPGTCENFIKLAEQGFYKGKEFYRVVKGHVIQAGGEDKDTVDYTIKAEINAHKHITGAVGMARGPELDSASTEFYICHAPRPHLDGKYTVFGQVTEGLDVLDSIGNTEVKEQFYGEVAFHRPVKPVVISKVTISTLRK